MENTSEMMILSWAGIGLATLGVAVTLDTLLDAAVNWIHGRKAATEKNLYKANPSDTSEAGKPEGK